MYSFADAATRNHHATCCRGTLMAWSCRYWPAQMLPRACRAPVCAPGVDVGERRGHRPCAAFRTNIGRGDDVELVPQVIEGQQPIEKGEHAIGKAESFGAIGQALELPYHVVGEVSNASEVNGGMPGTVAGRCCCNVLAQTHQPHCPGSPHQSSALARSSDLFPARIITVLGSAPRNV